MTDKQTAFLERMRLKYPCEVLRPRLASRPPVSPVHFERAMKGSIRCAYVPMPEGYYWLFESAGAVMAFDRWYAEQVAR